MKPLWNFTLCAICTVNHSTAATLTHVKRIKTAIHQSLLKKFFFPISFCATSNNSLTAIISSHFFKPQLKPTLFCIPHHTPFSAQLVLLSSMLCFGNSVLNLRSTNYSLRKVRSNDLYVLCGRFEEQIFIFLKSGALQIICGKLVKWEASPR